MTLYKPNLPVRTIILHYPTCPLFELAYSNTQAFSLKGVTLFFTPPPIVIS